LNSLHIHVNATPANRQDRNGLSERHWQTMVAMARNRLASAELPSKFWFFAMKRAAEVCNYFPLQLEDNLWTTPFTLARGVKPDLRVLFKMFGLAEDRHERSGDTRLNKFESQSVPMIAVGRCPHSNGLQFYNPCNGTFTSSIDYHFQHNVTSGTHFNLKYQPGVFIYRLDETNSVFAPKFHLDTHVHVHTHSPSSTATVIGLPSYSYPNVYTAVFPDGSISEYTDDLLSTVPEILAPGSSSLLPSWIKGGTNATLFLHSMSKSRHGVLQCSENNEWSFYPGKSTSGILLPDFSATCQQLLDTGQLFKGHTKFKNVYDARAQLGLYDCVLWQLSAHGLSSLIAPTSL
jgi:hypothetical protein